MANLELSIMNHSPAVAETMRKLLDEFEQRTRNHVNLRILDWEDGKAELTHYAIYHQGADVSEVATTWAPDLISMNALRPFKPQELARIGRPEDFVPAAWQINQPNGVSGVCTVPWVSESYMIYYRKDLLQKAGIAENEAFLSHEHLADTAQRLAKNGVDIPVELSFTWDQYGLIHALASWVWGAGSDFCDAEGKQVLLTRPQVLAAIHAYFDLLKLISPQGQQTIRENKGNLFIRGLTGIMFSTLYHVTDTSALAPVVRDNLGAAVMPGGRFVGGSNLAIWKHSRQESAAVELVNFLNATSTLLQMIEPFRALPCRLDALAMPQITGDPLLSVYAQSVQSGRTYPQVPLWGLIEDRLYKAFVQIAVNYLDKPENDLHAAIDQQMQALTRRLNLTLSQ